LLKFPWRLLDESSDRSQVSLVCVVWLGLGYVGWSLEEQYFFVVVASGIGDNGCGDDGCRG